METLIGRPAGGPRRRRSRLLGVALVLLLAACDTDGSLPTRARVVASAAGGGGGTVRLITSSAFVSEPADPQSLELLSADTSLVSLPLDRELEIALHAGRRMLYVELAPAGPEPLTVHMRVLLSGEPWYDIVVEMPEARHRFLYMQR